MARPSRYPDEFRREAVQMALATKGSWAAIARRLGVNETTLRNWVHEHLAAQKRADNPLALNESEFEELRRLRREVKELRVEKEILREAASFFARETIRSAASGSSPSSEDSMESSGFAGSWESPGPGSTPKRNDRRLKGSRPTEP
jgi:transposase